MMRILSFYIISIGFSLHLFFYTFQTRRVCFSMHNSLNIVHKVCTLSTMLAIQRISHCLDAVYQFVIHPLEQFIKLK